MLACNKTQKGTEALIKTSYGDIRVHLYDETPIHRDNFIKLAKSGSFDGSVFHRVIKNFMIQGGDTEKGTPENDSTSLTDTIPAEIRFPKLYHKRGALAAARWGDDVNPTKASDAKQFYIVTGRKFYEPDLKEMEKQRFERLKQTIYQNLQTVQIDTLKTMYREGNKSGINDLREKWRAQAEEEAKSRQSELLYTNEQKEVYKTQGGAAFLDGEYTVFGEVLEGMDVVDKIQNVQTSEKDRPIQNIIMKIELIK